MERAVVVRRHNGDRVDPEPLAGAEDPNGDLAAVGHEERADRHRPALYADVRGSLARGSRSDGVGTVTGCDASAS